MGDNISGISNYLVISNEKPSHRLYFGDMHVHTLDCDGTNDILEHYFYGPKVAGLDFGCYDMCGNTREWTESERADAHTPFYTIRGGSFYKAEGSRWYADGGPQPTNVAAKLLLSWPALDRCDTIGFRCVVDVAK